MDKIREEIRLLSETLRKYQHAYYVTGRPLVSDAEFDREFDRLLSLEEKYPRFADPDSPTRRVGSDLTSDLPEVDHTIPVLSLDKAYSVEELQSWAARIALKSEETVSFFVEEKMDGISIVLYYRAGRLERAVTRGNGFRGNDVTANVATIGAVPLKLTQSVDIAVRGEIYLPLSRFHAINAQLETPYANPRNLTAGVLRRKKSAEVASIPLTIFAYEGFFGPVEALSSHREVLELLDELGFRTNPACRYFDPDCLGELAEYVREKTEQRPALDYEIDGLVVKVDEIAVREQLGYTGHHPRWEIAYKFDSPQGVSRVESIDVQVGRTGRITPVARIAPVEVGGSTISNVTLHNQDYIDILELAVGDTVTIARRGDVIPAVEEVLEKNGENHPLWTMPRNCPSCGTSLEKRGAHHFCRNRTCPDQVKGRLFFFIGKGQMDIGGFGPETAAFLLDGHYIADIEDLYTFDYNRLANVPGFGEKKIALLQKGILDSREQPFETVLTALGIPDLGRKVAQLLIGHGFDSIERLYAWADTGSIEELVAIDGIGEKTAENLRIELVSPELRRRIGHLQQAGLHFRAEIPADNDAPQIFAGQSWCVTGSFENFKPRDLAMEEIRRRGGRTVGSVTGKTTHLLAGAGAGSKLQKAEKNGAVIVSEAEFLSLIN